MEILIYDKEKNNSFIEAISLANNFIEKIILEHGNLPWKWFINNPKLFMKHIVLWLKPFDDTNIFMSIYD